MKPMTRCAAVVCLLCATTPLAAAPTITRIAELTAAPLAEVSGIARSGYSGVFWVHNDSGDEARIFAIDRTGTPIVPDFLASQFVDKPWPGIAIRNAWNIDWEDITVDDGAIYIAETGNNGNARRDLGVYVVMEPNPRATAEIRALSFIPMKYPDQDAYPGRRWEFDCEALFADDGKLYFLTKHRKPGEITGWAGGTSLYRLETRYTDRLNELTLVSRRDDVILATAAALSPRKDRLAVLSYLALAIFDRPKDGDDWLKGDPVVISIDRELIPIAEAVTWEDDSTLLIANEGRGLFEVRL
jgi:hypothetical protein